MGGQWPPHGEVMTMARDTSFGESLDRLIGRVQAEMVEIEDEVAEIMEKAREAGATLAQRPLLYGWSLQMDEAGQPRFRSFGNLGKEIASLAEGWREPLISWHVDEEAREVHVTAELPGLSKEDIDVEVDADRVAIDAETEGRKYRARCTLPVGLEAEGSQAIYDNGVLDLVIPIQKTQASKPHKIEVRVPEPEKTAKSAKR